MTLHRELEDSRSKKDRGSRRNLEGRREVDLFSEARKVIGLFPVKPRHILEHHQGDYTPSLEDVPQLNAERLLAALEFLRKEYCGEDQKW